jgi:hypothetical protein
MALQIGSENTNAGMSLAIYQEIDKQLSPPLKKAIDEAKGAAKPKAQEALDEARKGWQKLSFAIAKGVIEHIKSNMEIFGITSKGNVNTAVSGNTEQAVPGPHSHAVNLSGVQNNVLFTQNNDGTGRVR